MKSATAYLRNGRIFLQPYSRTVSGFRIAWEPVLATSENDGELGGQILLTLAKSTQGVPDPEMPLGRVALDGTKALLKAAGISTYEAFADFTKCVMIASEEDGVEFAPTMNGGRGKRFISLKKKKIRCHPVEAEVAEALRLAFDACE